MEGASSSIIMLVVLIAVFYFMLIRPENKRKKKAQEMRDSLKKGDIHCRQTGEAWAGEILPARSLLHNRRTTGPASGTGDAWTAWCR